MNPGAVITHVPQHKTVCWGYFRAVGPLLGDHNCPGITGRSLAESDINQKSNDSPHHLMAKGICSDLKDQIPLPQVTPCLACPAQP